MFETRSAELALRTTLCMMHLRIRESILGGEYDPRMLAYVTDVRRLATGGGASGNMPRRHRLQGLLARPGDSAIRSYFGPQPTVEAAFRRPLEFLALGLWPRYVPLFSADSRGLMEGGAAAHQGME
jgi:hypothetical protein